MITDLNARNEIMNRIDAAPAGKRRGHGSAFRSDSSRARYLARGERIVGIVGGFRYSAIYSPAGARGSHPSQQVDRILFYDASAVLAHEEPATGAIVDWFNAAYDRAA